ncbi:MAG: tetratricopeptide repeat protein [bacterium]
MNMFIIGCMILIVFSITFYRCKRLPLYDRVIVSCIVVMVFTIPLFFGLNINALDLQKIAFMYTLSLIIAITWIVKIVFTRELKFVRTPIDIPILAFLLISIIATIFSINPIISLFGFYGHFEGLLVVINYIFLFYCVVNFINKELVLWFINVIILSGVLVAGYGIIQHYGLDPVKWELFTGGRVSSSLGNPIGFGNYIIMVLGITICMFFSREITHKQEKKHTVPSKKKKKKRRVTLQYPEQPKTQIEKIPFWVYGICIGIILYGFCFSASRAPFLGMVGGLALIGILLGKKIITYKRQLLGIFGVIFLCYLVFSNINPELAVIGRFATIFKPSPPKQVSPFEVGTFTATSMAKLNPRIYIWQGALNIILDYPILGIGLDTVGIIHSRYKPVESAMAEGAYATAASVHNELLDIWVSRGTIGLIIYLWLLITFIIICLKTYWHADGMEKFLIPGLLSALFSHLIQNSFSPTGVSSSSFFWIILASGMIFRAKSTSFPLPITIKELRWIISLATIGMAIWLWILLVVRPCIADFNYEQGTLLQAMPPEYKKDTQYRFERALQFNPYETQYYREVCSIYLHYAQDTGDEVWIKKTITQAQKLIALNPDDGVGNSILGAGYYLGGKELDKAVKAFKKAIEVDPYNPDPHNTIGLVYQRLGKYDEAIKEFKQALWLKPDYSMALTNLMRTYAQSGKGDIKADIKELLAKESGPRTIWLRERLVSFYLEENNLDEALKQCLIILHLNPENANTCKILGNIYAHQGKIDEAKKAFEYLLKLSPDDIYAKEFLSKWKN